MDAAMVSLSSKRLNDMICDGDTDAVIKALRAEKEEDRKQLVNNIDSSGRTSLISCFKELNDEKVALKLVRFLVVECGADVNLLDGGYPRSVMTVSRAGFPLSVALERNFKSVELALIGYGANIRGVELETKESSVQLLKPIDPIMAACSRGNIGFLNHVISLGISVNGLYLGGGFNIKRTCLMEALPDIKMVKFLIEKGADIDAVDCVGQTAVHYAADAKNTEAMDLLLESGAIYKWDNETPTDVLYHIAAHGHQSLLEHFISHTEHTQEQIINSYELLGAYISNLDDTYSFFDNDDFQRASKETAKWWLKAMKMRYKNPSQSLKKVPPSNRLVFKDSKEPETLQELRALWFNRHVFNIQRFLIAERILGCKCTLFMEMTLDMYFACAYGIPKVEEFRCRAVTLAAIKEDVGLIEGHGLCSAGKLMYLLSRDANVPMPELLEVIPVLADMIETILNQPGTTDPHSSLLVGLAFYAMKLCVLVQKKYETDSAVSDIIDPEKTVNEFGKRIVKRINEDCNQTTQIIDKLVEEDFPIGEVQFIMRYGMDVNVRSAGGDNILLRLAKSIPQDQTITDWEKYKTLINLFLKHGAHMDICNAMGETFFDHLPNDLKPDYQYECMMKPLQCLAAKVIADNHFDVSDNLPYHLRDFVCMHKPPR